ncbi:MAG: ABC transporter permease [Firmicutes bacterium]|nr:ABC transporter permease [Bacillota bacterium]
MSKATKIQLLLLDNLVWVLLALFFIFNAFYTPSFCSWKNLVNILFQSSLVGMLVLAQGVVMMVGELDLSIEATLCFAPGLAILLAQAHPGLSPALLIVLTLAFGCLIGLFNGLLVAKLHTNSFLMTMSTQIVMRGLILFMVPFSLSGLDPVYTFLGRGRVGDIPVAAIAFLLIFLVFELLFRKTVFGRKFKLTGGNRQAAFISGINTDNVVVQAFIIAGLLAAVAGLIAAGRQNAINNTMGQNMVMMAFAGAILGGCSFNGGMGKPIGMLGGALLLGMIDNSLTLLNVNVSLVSATKGALIFLAILLDRVRVRYHASLMYRENLKKLGEAERIQITP